MKEAAVSTTRWRGGASRLASVALVALAIGACDRSDNPLEPASAPMRSENVETQVGRKDVVTTSPQEFAEAIRRIGNGNEVIVLLKDPAVAPVAGDFLRTLPLGTDLVVGVRDVPANAPRRRQPGLARAGATARAAMLRVLQNHGVEPYRMDDHALALRVPDDKLVPVLAVLLHHPSVDYVEANQRRLATTTAGPLGSNPVDTKHTFHNVLGAWDYTRGAGVKVGILDSGYANNRTTGQWHPDGQLINSTTGIQKLGFGDDYDNYINCDGNGSQPYGTCVPWDDNYDSGGHGTAMAGLVGANDNGIGTVGVMPHVVVQPKPDFRGVRKSYTFPSTGEQPGPLQEGERCANRSGISGWSRS